MPGYDRSRFVNLTETEDQEFECGICFQILKNPLIVGCCRQAFCEQCIKQWLNTSNLCPNDRIQLKADNLLKPPRLVDNLLGKLQIHCDFHSNGCQQIVQLKQLPLHSLYCRFNPSIKCKDLALSDNMSHQNFVQNIMNQNKSLNEELKRLRLQIKILKKQIKKTNKDKNWNQNVS